ncbi:class I SAM-dependent methyltransferase [Geodermatophilus sp. SYSU D00867]
MPTAAVDTVPTGATGERVLNLAVLDTLGVDLPSTARILDFGCGAGRTVRDLRAMGFVNASGYDVGDGRSLVGTDREHITTGTLLDLRLPYPDDTFDLVISDQVFEHVQDQARAFEELFRITRPGGHALHVIPARYAPIEGHMFVPFGGVLQHRWWYKLWALAGIRNGWQAGLSADETADHNALFATESTRYVATSCYRVLWREIGYEYRFAEQEFFDGHVRPSMRVIGRLGRPAMWLYRTFRSRIVYLHKPAQGPSSGTGGGPATAGARQA